MPRRPHLAAGDLAYHVLNHRVRRLPLFEKLTDGSALEKILTEVYAQTKIRIAAYNTLNSPARGGPARLTRQEQ